MKPSTFGRRRQRNQVGSVGLLRRFWNWVVWCFPWIWLVALARPGEATAQAGFAPAATPEVPIALGSGEWLTTPLQAAAVDALVGASERTGPRLPEPPGAPYGVLPNRVPVLVPAWAADQDFAEVVAVVNNGRALCAGVLLGPRHVLTARHCLPASHVRFGHDALHPLAERKVVAVQTPPDRGLDAALLRLELPVLIPIPQWRGARDSAAPGGLVRAVGFGSTRRSLNPNVGRKRYVELYAFGWGCDVGRARSTGCLPELELLLLQTGGRDTCEGDSGGPLYEQWAGRRRLIALTSRSIDGAHVACGDGGVYVRLDRLAPWLEPVLQGDLALIPKRSSL